MTRVKSVVVIGKRAILWRDSPLWVVLIFDILLNKPWPCLEDKVNEEKEENKGGEDKKTASAEVVAAG